MLSSLLSLYLHIPWQKNCADNFRLQQKFPYMLIGIFTLKQKSAMSMGGSTSIYATGWVLAVALLLIGGYVWIARTSTPRVAEPPEQVIIAASTGYAGTCPIFAAVDKGYFASEGIVPVIQPQTNGRSALEAALRGEANLATVGDVPVKIGRAHV